MKKLIAFIAMSMAVASAQACYSEGIRTGVLQKITKKGFVFTSVEGELAVAGSQVSSNKYGVTGGNVFKFSITDVNAANTAFQASEQGKAVSVAYCQSIVNWNWVFQDSKYTVTKVTILN